MILIAHIKTSWPSLDDEDCVILPVPVAQLWHESVSLHKIPAEVSCRAGHATTLSRQRDHIFSPQHCWLLHYVSIRWDYTPFRHRNIFPIFSCPWSFIYVRCRVGVVARLNTVACPALLSREALNNNCLMHSSQMLRYVLKWKHALSKRQCFWSLKQIVTKNH